LSRCSFVLLSVRTIGYRGVLWRGGEGVSQSRLKDQAFSTFLDQNPPFELPPENGFRLRKKPVPSRNLRPPLTDFEDVGKSGMAVDAF
jgi:hypothetical protein